MSICPNCEQVSDTSEGECWRCQYEATVEAVEGQIVALVPNVCRYCGNGCGAGYDVCGAYACNMADNAEETATHERKVCAHCRGRGLLGGWPRPVCRMCGGTGLEPVWRTDCCGREIQDSDTDDSWGPDSQDDNLATCVYGHGCNVDGNFVHPSDRLYADRIAAEDAVAALVPVTWADVAADVAESNPEWDDYTEQTEPDYA